MVNQLLETSHPISSSALLSTVSSRCAVDRLPNAGDNSILAQTLVGAPILRRGNEYFSKRT